MAFLGLWQLNVNPSLPQWSHGHTHETMAHGLSVSSPLLTEARVIGHIGLGAALIASSYLHLQRPLFPNKATFLGGRDS